MRRLVGISFACLVTSACTIGKTPEEESTSRYPGEATGQPQRNGETPTGEAAAFPEGPITIMGLPTVTFEQPKQPFAGFEPIADGHGAIADPCRVWRTNGTTLFGKAAWYNFVGRQTASGEILDTVTATAAHRSLPLASYAKVTNLGNGHAVVVKINDRGPYNRGRILDLSPRAADALDMKRVGVAAVEIEPLVNETAPTVAIFQTPGTAVSQ
jgi:rare lipoprotein A (peptidoglycan hydrolase)